MFKKIISRYLDTNKKILDRLEKTVAEINALEPEIKKLKKSDFKKETQKLKKKVKTDEDLSKILPRAYALAREAAWRELGLRAYDVQLMAAIAIHEGNVAEQKTGEGKTLSAVFPLYLRALMGKGVHLVTVNDYLARRDAGWNAPVYHLLGLSVGAIVQESKSFIYDPKYNDSSHGDERLAHLKPVARRQAYEADITYGTNNEFGFDYLRDNMVQSLERKVQRGHYFVIVDEVDSILIDEARTPLIISAPDTDPTDKYYKFAEMITKLNPDTDYIIDEKVRSANLTEHGITRVEKIMGVDNLYEKDWEAIHHIENALKARTLYLRDRDYVVKDDQVIIVDEFTGRLMVGRRWSDGMHQAVEAKEGVQIQQESKTMATISFQNYFRMYEHLSGMTATAATEAEEFQKIYELNVVVLPTNDPMIRKDHQDVVYKTLRAKYTKIAEEILKESEKGRPVLVGTTSIEKNEIVSSYLKKKKISHNVLNAKNHEKEAMIIAEAGKPGAVTVATNMAGRGVDIVLGGAKPDKEDGVSDKKYKATKEYKKWQERHSEVVKAGGLHVIGTERHESRRIDNQLRGRSGRQGDPGSSKFFLSLEDDLMRIFGGDQIGAIMSRFNLPEDQPIENKLVSRAIEQAQVKVEGFHFDSRKNVVEYDDVANQQRDIIYKLRNKILEEESIKKDVMEKLEEQVEGLVFNSMLSEENGVDSEKILAGMLEIVPIDERSRNQVRTRLINLDDKEKVKEFLIKMVNDIYSAREKQVGKNVMRNIEKFAYLGAIDNKWVDHIDHIDGLREGVRLRGYAQRDPIAEFKNEAYGLFETLLDRIDEELARRIFRIGVRTQRSEIPLDQIRTNEDREDKTGLVGGEDLAAETGKPAFAKAQPGKSAYEEKSGASKNYTPPDANEKKQKVGRNDPCPCGSGKKYKKCCYPKFG